MELLLSEQGCSEVSLYEYIAYEGPLDDNEPIHE